MEREVIEVPLTAEERALILRYGYPFDRIKAALTSRSDSREIEIVPLDAFELERLIGDLSIPSPYRSAASSRSQSSSRASCMAPPSISAEFRWNRQFVNSS